MVEFRWHGRGGQGAWTASELLARTALDEGKFIQSFPEFGPERMGAPVTAFTRISTEPIRLHCAIYDPDVVVVLDNTLLKTVPVTAGLNRDEDKFNYQLQLRNQLFLKKAYKLPKAKSGRSQPPKSP